MPDDLEKLRATLTELHRELEAARSLDGDSLAMMRRVMADLEQAIARGEEAGRSLDTQTVQRVSIVRRLGDAARGFEATHPVLSGAIGGVLDALAQMGI